VAKQSPDHTAGSQLLIRSVNPPYLEQLTGAQATPHRVPTNTGPLGVYTKHSVPSKWLPCCSKPPAWQWTVSPKPYKAWPQCPDPNMAFGAGQVASEVRSPQ
jgi:hypothetical protein